MRTHAVAFVVAALALALVAGCSGPAKTQQKLADDYCFRCQEYVGDYSRATELPYMSPETERAFAQMEAAGEHEHIGHFASTIVRRYRDMPSMAFDPDDNDVDRHFNLWVKTQLGMDQPWKPASGQTTVKHVTMWIRANRAKLPPSEMLDKELAMAM